jgi:hypothetical protein
MQIVGRQEKDGVSFFSMFFLCDEHKKGKQEQEKDDYLPFRCSSYVEEQKKENRSNEGAKQNVTKKRSVEPSRKQEDGVQLSERR